MMNNFLMDLLSKAARQGELFGDVPLDLRNRIDLAFESC
jgi:hypothetical protein